MRPIPLFLALLLLQTSSIAFAGVPLKPDPLTCVGVEDESGDPLVLDVHFTEEGGQTGGRLGSRVSYNKGRAGRQMIEGAPALSLLTDGNPRLELREEGKYALNLSGGEIDRIVSEQAAGTLGGDYSYRVSGSWQLGGANFPVDCEVKFVK